MTREVPRATSASVRKGVLIAGGGTGGHVVPGLAIARALIAGGMPIDDIHWVGSSRGMEVVDVPDAGIGLTVLPGRGLERRLTLANVANMFGILRAIPRAIGIVRKRRPSVVVCLGGYAAVPASIGAVVMRVPLVIQEQNAKPSLANRVVSRWARASAVLVAGTGLRNEVVTGNPLRDEIRVAVGRDASEAKAALGVDENSLLVLAFGGSLGSLRINIAVTELAGDGMDREDIAIHHVIGRRDWESFRARIRELDGNPLHYRAVEFESDMATALAAADVVVCRSGGMTVSEVAALGVPSIMVPLPISPNDAQRHNTRALVDEGAAVLVSDIELTGERLASELEKMLEGDLASMAIRARQVGRPDASKEIATLITGLMA